MKRKTQTQEAIEKQEYKYSEEYLSGFKKIFAGVRMNSAYSDQNKI